MTYVEEQEGDYRNEWRWNFIKLGEKDEEMSTPRDAMNPAYNNGELQISFSSAFRKEGETQKKGGGGRIGSPSSVFKV